MQNTRLFKIIGAGIVLSIVLALSLWSLSAELPTGEELRVWFDQWGVWGPVAVVVTMAAAIMISPIPSAPIALAAGALYGHNWGTLYIVIGAELGAIGAFAVARYFGYELLHKWFGEQLNQGLAGSQNFLTVTVFISRLIPFISFDIISYAAGLTAIKFWRFAGATLAGVIPISYVLAHFGSEMVAEETDRIMFAVLLLGMITIVPLVIRQLIKARNKQK